MYWAARGTPSKVAADLIHQRAGRIIQIDSADTFFEQLERLVSTQAKAKKQNPKSVELMVASAKRFLAKTEHRIELDDLVGEEVRRIARALRGSDFDVTGGPFSNERVVQSIIRYEGLAEALVRILGVLGRWGAGPELKMVGQVLAQLGVRDVLAGFTRLIYLRTYPGLLAFYGYGLGLLRADRYNDLFRLFSFEVANENDQRAPIVDRLLLQTWEGDHENNFKLLPDHERRRTALSDHLHDIFKEWSSDTSFVDAEYTRLFEEFEFLGTLAHITLKYSKADLQGALVGGNFAWCPMGRISWDGQNFRKIVDRWKNEELIALMLQAGFAHRDRDFFTLANQNMERTLHLMGRY
jgi:hypothetical protein